MQILRRLRNDRRGLAMLEFAFTAPLVLTIGCYGVELANHALISMKLSQVALNLADNASRMGALDSTNIESFREGDMNDMFQAVRLQGAGIDLTKNGRIIVSSLENVQQSYDTAPVQRIHWQRCIGKRGGTGYDSSYGTTSVSAGTTDTQANAGTLAPNGMGDSGAKVNAPPNSGLIFVEINYDYQPFFGSLFVKPTRMHYTASMVVRNSRNFKQIFNPVGYSQRATCNLYSA